MHVHPAKPASPIALASSLRLQEAVAAVAALQESSLVLQDGERILQACDLGRAACLAVRVRLWPGNATVLDLAVVLVHRSQLRGGGVAIALIFRGRLAQGLHGLRLVLEVTLLGGLGDLALLGHLV